MSSGKNKQRTYARNRVLSRKGREVISESDGQFLLKLVLVVILGTFWLKFRAPLEVGIFTVSAIPVGLALGLILVNRFEKYQFNRKLWYSTLILISVICLFAPAGIVL